MLLLHPAIVTGISHCGIDHSHACSSVSNTVCMLTGSNSICDQAPLMAESIDSLLVVEPCSCFMLMHHVPLSAALVFDQLSVALIDNCLIIMRLFLEGYCPR